MAHLNPVEGRYSLVGCFYSQLELCLLEWVSSRNNGFSLIVIIARAGNTPTLNIQPIYQPN